MPLNITEDIFKYQFDSQDVFLRQQKEKGSFSFIDLDYNLTTIEPSQKIHVTDLKALVNKLILYLISSKGDYLRSEKGGPLSFIKNNPINESIIFRIQTAITNTINIRFPSLKLNEIEINPHTGPDGTNGWNIHLTISSANTGESIELSGTLNTQTGSIDNPEVFESL